MNNILKTKMVDRFFNLSPKICIYDLDGTVIDSSHRATHDENGNIDLSDWIAKSTKDLIFQDQLMPLYAQLQGDYKNGNMVILCTARLLGKYDLEYIVNFGSGDGYHIIGLLKNEYFKEGLAFEINKFGQENIKENLLLNDISDKVKIFDKADFNIVNKNLTRIQLKKTLFIVDIEGAEFELFNKANLEVFKESTLIIENHDFLAEPKKVGMFFDFMNKHFNLEILKNGSRDPFKVSEIDNFDEDEKWLMMSEGRKKNMNWLIFTPKSYDSNA